MPVPGLSLVGFMDQTQAMQHLVNACLPPDPSPKALIEEWASAKARLGAALASPGRPDVRELPSSLSTHAQELRALPWVQQLFADSAYKNMEVALVEIDPLIAFQFTINTDRSAFHCSSIEGPQALKEMADACLPLQQQTEKFDAHTQPGSLIIKSRSLNLRMQGQGLFNTEYAGVVFRPAPPFVQVVEYNGRYYLHNGFHRAYGLRKAGATHMPCIVRPISDPRLLGISDGTFQLPLLESDNPPTLAHFTQGRAHEVSLKLTARVIHVSWAEWVVSDD